MSDDALITAFEDTTLPFESWTHEAHLRVACIYLMRLGPDRALDEMRTRIRAYNAAHNVPSTPTRGYHETITVAWIRALTPIVHQHAGEAGSLGVLARAPEVRDQGYLHRFYSRGLLASPEARAAFVPPDVAPLPRL